MVNLQSLNPFAPTVKATTQISQLRIYPIKSCRGFSVPSSYLTNKGLDLDRNWMFTTARDDKQHKFVTIRDISELTLIDTALASSAGAPANGSEDDLQLVISIRDKPDARVVVPARPTAAWLEAHTTLATVDIWGADTDGWVYGDAVNALVRAHIHHDVRLVYKGPTPRVLRGNGAPDLLGRSQATNFPDVLPLLIASDASLAELNGRLTARGAPAISIERFRPNIVVRGGDADGVPAWAEDDWKTVRVAAGAPPSGGGGGGLLGASGPPALDIDVAAHCARCQVPNVDPATARKDAHEPWDTLVSYRRIDEGIKWKPCFGMLCCPRNEGPIRVGMQLEVLETTAAHLYVKGF